MSDLLTKAVATARFEARLLRPGVDLVSVDINIRALTDAVGEVVGS